MRLRGHPARSIRIDLLDEDTAQHVKIVHETVTKLYSDAAEIDSVRLENIDRVDEPLSLDFVVSFPHLSVTGEKVFLNPMDYFSKNENPFTSDEREGPVVFDYAYEDREAVEFTLPAGWQVEALPADTMFTNQVGRIGYQFVAFGDKLSVQRVFLLDLPLFPAEEYSAVRKLYDTRQALDKAMVILAPATEIEPSDATGDSN